MIKFNTLISCSRGLVIKEVGKDDNTCGELYQKEGNSYLSPFSGWLRSNCFLGIQFSVLQCSLSLSISLLLSQLFLIPFQGGHSFLYIAVWIASHSSTWRAIDISLDTCPIIALLVAVE